LRDKKLVEERIKSARQIKVGSTGQLV